MPSQMIEPEHVILGLLETDCEIINFCLACLMVYVYSTHE